MKNFILFLLVLIYTQNSYSQTSTTSIFGKIQNAKKELLPDVSITLLQKENNKVVGGNISDDKGTFTIDNIIEGNYKLRISSIGLKERIIDNINISTPLKPLNMGTVTLQPSENALKEVSVVGEKNMFQMDIDKKVFNVDKNITSTGGSALDVLQNVPSVSVDASGGVSLRGKSNVNILIDGRPATLMGGDINSALQSLPASSIDNIAIITNPSAKYDAEGQAGIINIITKVNKSNGLSGTATLGAGTGNKYNGGINMNLRKDKWNFALNSNFRLSQNRHTGYTDRKYFNSDSGSHNDENRTRRFNGNFNSLSVAYSPNTQNTITITQNVNFMRFGSAGYQVYDLFSRPNDIYDRQHRDQEFKGGPNSGTTSTNWLLKFKKPKQELVTDASISYSKSNSEQNIGTYNLDNYNNIISNTIAQQVLGNNKNRNANFQSDFTTPVGTNGKFETGIKSQNLWFESVNNATITIPNGGTYTDPLLQNQFKYQQHTHAAYTNYSNQIDKFSYQGGLRVEDAVYSGYGGITGSTYYSNSFLNLFPSAYVAYQIKDMQQIYLNYTRRTSRPWFMQLMPYINISNALDTTSGNPNLKPEFTDNIELAYNQQLPKGNNITASIYFQNTNNLIQNYTKSYADGTSFSQRVNLASGQTYGLELIGKTQITKSWDATLSANLFNNQLIGSNIDPSLNNNGFAWFTKLNSNYKINKQYSLQLMANYNSPKPTVQGQVEDNYWMDLAFKANLLKDNRLTITLNVSDIFNTRSYRTDYNLPLYYQYSYSKRESRVGTITLSYRFGNTNNNMSNTFKGRKKRNNKKEIEERDSNLNNGGGDDDNGGGGGMRS